MTDYPEIIKSFLSEQFGALMGRMLLEEYLKRINIKSIGKLSHDEMVAFAEDMLRQIFGKHLTPQEVDEIVLRLRVNFSITKSIDFISRSTGNKVSLDRMYLKSHDVKDLTSLFDEADKTAISIRTMLTGDVSGNIVLLISKDQAGTLKELLTKKIDWQDDTNWAAMDNPEVLVKTFFGKLLPTLSYEISYFTKKDIKFSEPEVSVEEEDNFITRMKVMMREDNALHEVVSEVLSSNFGININDLKIGGLFVFLKEREPNALGKWIKSVEKKIMTKTKMSPQEIARKELVKLGKIKDGIGGLDYEQRKALIQLVGEHRSNSDKIVDKFFKEVPNISLMHNLEKVKIVEEFIRDNFEGASPQAIAFIRQGAYRILKVS